LRKKAKKFALRVLKDGINRSQPPSRWLDTRPPQIGGSFLAGDSRLLSELRALNTKSKKPAPCCGKRCKEGAADRNMVKEKLQEYKKGVGEAQN
jgi:hypothetical protein